MMFSVVIPVKDEVEFLSVCLSSCSKITPDEIIVATDKPADPRVSLVVKKVTNTRILEVEENKEYLFHQAWVKRRAFREAKHDKILVVDVDQSLTRKCLKAVEVVGRDNIAVVSLSKLFYARGLVRLIRALQTFLLVKSSPVTSTTGLYALYRPFWLRAEPEESLKRLKNPKFATGRFVSYGEDTHLFNHVGGKYRIIALKDIGCFCLSDQLEDVPYVQFETGRYHAQQGWTFRKALRYSFNHMRPFLLKGYLYQDYSSVHYSKTLNGVFKIVRTTVRVGLRFLGKKRRNVFLPKIDLKIDLIREFILTRFGILASSAYEPQVSRKVIQFRGERFIDVGANTGYYCRLLFRNFREVIAVEPHPDNIRMLERSLKGISNITVMPIALSDTQGEVDLYQAEHCAGHTIETVSRHPQGGLPGRVEPRPEVTSIKVEAKTLDSFSFENIDLVKIDAESAEWRILSGARQSLTNHAIKRLVIELHDRTRRPELEQLLSDYGYKFAWLSRGHILAEAV